MPVPTLTDPMQQASVSRRTLWRNRDYMLLWSGQTVSAVGTGISQLAFPLLVYALTGSAALTGVAGALEAVPYVFLSLPAGALVDRWDRKRVMLLCDTCRALAMASIPLALVLGRLTVFQVFAVALIEGTLFVFFNLAEVACLPRVVSKEQLPVATAQNLATNGVTALISPSLGGALFSLLRPLPFAADALSYAASVLSLRFIRTRFQGDRDQARQTLRVEIVEGLHWLWRQPLIRYMAFLTGGLNFVGSGLILTVIVLAKQQHAPDYVIGLIFTVGGIGGIAGAILGPSVQRRVRFGRVVITVLWIDALLQPLLAVAPNPLLLGAILAALFVFGPIYDTTQFSYRIALIPDELQGRVNSVFRLLAFGFQPLGLALTGLLIQMISVVPTILLGMACYLALAVMTTLNHQVRHARPHGAAVQNTYSK
jgi:MFS family permease